MPAGKRISSARPLPKSLRAQLYARAAEADLRDYTRLTRWLAARGCRASRSTLHRALSPFKHHLDTLRGAQFMRAASGQALPLGTALLAAALDNIAAVLKRRTAGRRPALGQRRLRRSA